MTNEIKREWESILAQPNLYIYGAAITASKLYDFIVQMGYKENIGGFLVTDGEKNVQKLCGLPVNDVHNFSDKSACVLVPHMGVYKEQICSLLESLSFNHVYLVGQLRAKTAMEERKESIPEQEEIGWEEYNSKSEEEKEKDAGIREQILQMLKEGQPDFGSIVPYQSLELIGLKGMRPTAYRIKEYGLDRILRGQDDVLDIGCNSGFLDISISQRVRSVTGIEYDGSLVKIAKLAADYLKAENCTFINSDFYEWYKDTETSYNVIFSFAIHHWLNLTPQEYVEALDRMLRTNGHICFESHIYGEDVEFDMCCEEFRKRGYSVLCEKGMNDDGVQNRQYVLLKKGND